MKRKSLRNELRDFTTHTLYAIVACEAGAGLLTYAGYHFDPLPPALFAVGVTAINKLGVFNRRPAPGLSVGLTTGGAMQSTKRGLFASTVRWSSGGNSKRGNDGYSSRTIRYDEPPTSQLFWDVQLSNRLQPVRVFEDDLHRFVVSVSRRQRGGLPPFSRSFFRRQWGEPEYNAMVQILFSCQLIYNRGQGASGKLTALTPYSVMWQVKNTYTALLH